MRAQMFLALAALSLGATPAHAGWPTVPEDALTVSNTASVFRSVADGAGGACFGWFDGTHLRVLRVDPAGAPAAGWPVEGIIVGTPPATFYALDIAAGPGGGVYVGWLSGSGVWLQHVAPDGAIAGGWPQGGYAFSQAYGSAQAWMFGLSEDGLGGVYVRWAASFGVRATRFQPNGTLHSGWFANGKLIFDYQTTVYGAVAPDGLGGLWLASINRDNLRLQRRDPAGNLVAQWTSANLTATGVRSPFLAADGVGGAVAIWNWRTETFAPLETGIIRVEPDGDPAPGWPGGGAWLAPIPAGWNVRQLTVDSQGSILPALSNEVTASTHVWRLTPGGAAAPGWPVGGLYLNHPLDSDHLRVLPDGEGGIYYGFIGAYAPSEVQVGRVNASGDVVEGWPAYGWITVRSNWALRADLGMVPGEAGGVIVSWRDGSNGEANHVNPDGTLGPAGTVAVAAAGSPDALAFGPTRPNPARGTVSFTLELPVESASSIVVFDPQGRLIRHIAGTAILPAGTHEFHWDLEDHAGRRVRPGVYLVRAAGASGVTTTRVVVAD